MIYSFRNNTITS